MTSRGRALSLAHHGDRTESVRRTRSRPTAATFATSRTFLGRPPGAAMTGAGAEVDRGDLRAFLGDAGRRGLAPRTVARKLSAVRTFFRHMHHEGEIPSQPGTPRARAEARPHAPGSCAAPRRWRPSFRWAEEAAEQEGGFTETRLLAALELLYGSGLRLSELTSLDTRSLDLAPGGRSGCSARGGRSASCQ